MKTDITVAILFFGGIIGYLMTSNTFFFKLVGVALFVIILPFMVGKVWDFIFPSKE